MALSLALLTGCGGSDSGSGADGGTGEPASKGSGAAAQGAAYKGPALPGFAKKATWSLDADAAPGVLDLGETLLFAKDSEGKYLTDAVAAGESDQGDNRVLFSADEPEPVTLEFRDAKTGAVRKTLKVTTDSVERTTWQGGAPAVAVGTSATTGSDGLTAEKETTSATLYGADGAKLGQSSPYEMYTLLGGYRVEKSDQTLRLVPLAGGAARTVTCTGTAADCTYDEETGTVDGSQTHAPLIAGGYYPGFVNATNYATEPEQVTLNDLATGKQVWTSADVKVPAGVRLNDEGEPESRGIRILRVVDRKILVAWKAAAAFSFENWVYAWYEIGGAAGPTASYKVSVEEPLFSPAGDFVARDKPPVSTTYHGTAIWQTADGKQLWDQQKGENALDPVRFTADGAILYGLADGTSGDTVALAVDTRTRKVLAKDLPEDGIPYVGSATGYGYLATDTGFFAFAPE
jgi:hypothetical protein